MKTQSSPVLAALVLASLAGSVHASVYTNDFESFDLGDMSTSPNSVYGWSSSDPTPDAGNIINAGGGSWGARSASLGFVAPIDNDEVFLSHSASTPLVGGGVDANFSVLFQVYDSDSGWGDGSEVRDTFGFRLENSSGDNLFSLFLTPYDQDPTPQTDTRFDTFSWSQEGMASPTVVLDSPLVAAQENFAYTFTIQFSPSGANDVSFVADVNGSAFSGTLTGVQTETITEFGAFWNTLNGKTAPGSNFLIFDQTKLVPEPSAMLLGLLGTSFVLVRRRRA